jgi:hypothetical protein
MGHQVNLFRAKEQADLLRENVRSVRYGPERICRRCLDLKTGERLLEVASHSIKVLNWAKPVESEKTWHKNDVHKLFSVGRASSSGRAVRASCPRHLQDEIRMEVKGRFSLGLRAIAAIW